MAKTKNRSTTTQHSTHSYSLQQLFSYSTLLLCFFVILSSTPTTYADLESAQSFEAFVQIQKDGGPLMNASFLYSWPDGKEKWIYELPNLTNLTILTDFTNDNELTICSLTCSHGTNAQDQLRYWVNGEDDEGKKLPYPGTINGVEVDIYSWVQGSTLITLYLTPNLKTLVRATFLDANSYTVISFWTYEKLAVIPPTFAVPMECNNCSKFDYDLIYVLNLPTGQGNTDDDFISPASTALVRSFASSVVTKSFGRFPGSMRGSVVNFEKIAKQRLLFNDVKASVLAAINDSTTVINNRGDPFELCRWYFSIASPAENQKFVVYVSQGSFADPQINPTQLAKVKQAGIIVFAATTDPSEDVSTIASFPAFAYTINNGAASTTSANSLVDSLCSTTPASCSCAHNETCACGICLCEFPWTNDYPSGITDCSICPRTASNFCSGNGEVNPDCKTCTCTQSCANGGIRDPLTCECSCYSPFSNNAALGITDCTFCAADMCIDCPCDSSTSCPTDCSGHGAQYPNCTCLCTPPWTNMGSIDDCSVCSRTDADFCNGHGTVDANCQNCTCSAFDCQNGGLLSNYCACKCPSPWNTHPDLGINDCTYCSYIDDGCPAGLVLDELACECFCNESIACGNGIFNDTTCTCSCDQNWGPSPDGSCTTCSLQDVYFCSGRGTIENCQTCQCDPEAGCENGGVLMEDCSCECTEPWRNDPLAGIYDCSICDLVPGVCPGESVLNSATCSCDCDLTESDCEEEGKVLDPSRCICVEGSMCGNGIVEEGEECDSSGPTDCCVDCQFVNESEVCTATNSSFPYPCATTAKCTSGVCESQISPDCDKCLKQDSCDECLDETDITGCAWLICANSWELLPGIPAPQRLCLPKDVANSFPFDLCSNFVVCPAPVTPSPSRSLSATPTQSASPSTSPLPSVPISISITPVSKSPSKSAQITSPPPTPSRTRTIRVSPSTSQSQTPTKTHKPPTPTRTTHHSRSPTPHPKKKKDDNTTALGLGLGLGLGGAVVLLAVGGAAIFVLFFSGTVVASPPPTPPSFSGSSTPQSSTPPSSTPPTGNTPTSSQIDGQQASPEEYLSRENPLFHMTDVLCET